MPDSLLTLVDLALGGALIAFWVRACHRRRPWMSWLVTGMLHALAGRGAFGQLLRFGPLIVGWLLLCHWVNTHGWHVTAASGIVLAMALALEAMRQAEETARDARRTGAI